MKDITILEPTQVPDEIHHFFSFDDVPMPDFYGRIGDDLYFAHCENREGCVIRFFRIIDEVLWFPCGSKIHPALDNLGHEIARFIHDEEEIFA